MVIDNTEYLVDASEIIWRLQADLALHNIPFLSKEARESGNNLQIQCPYHGNGIERKPSAGIRKTDGIFHCFACGETHTLPEVISYCFGYQGDMYGRKWLDEHVPEKMFYAGKTHHHDSHKQKIHTEYVSEEKLDSYRYTHPYWSKRGITDANIIELFDLGYDKKTDCITFPVRDKNGNCEFVARRSVRTKFFSYPEGVSKPLYGLYELMQEYNCGYNISPVIVCESMIDSILLWQSQHHAVALNGLGNDRQFKQLSELPCNSLILATDNDDAGKKARERIKSKVTNKLISYIQFPKGIKDPGDCSRYQLDNILEWRKCV